MLGIAFILSGLLTGRFRPKSGSFEASWLVRISSRTFLTLAAVSSLLLTAGVQFFVFQGIPHVTDALSHTFQASLFCHGRLFAPVPPCFEHFSMENVIMSADGKWHSKYFPGQAIWLAWGQFLGAPWLPMPLGQALTTVSLVYLADQFWSRVHSRLSGVLFVLSPLALLLGGSYMSHTTFLMWATSGLALAVRATECSLRWKRRLGGFLAGSLAGLAGLTRPQDAAAYALLAVAAVALTSSNWRKRLGSVFVPALAGVLLPLGLLLGWNQSLYGSFLATGYHFSSSPSLTHIIHDSLGLTPSYSAQDALRHSAWTILRFNKVLFGWPASLLLMPLALAVRSPDRRALFCAASLVAIMALSALFPYYGFEYEARYYYPAVPFAIALSAEGLIQLRRRLAGFASRAAPADTAGWWAGALSRGLLAAFFLHAFLYYWPSYLWPVYAHDYELASPQIHQLAEQPPLRNAIVLIRADGQDDGRYSSGFPYNDPFLRNSILYARDLADKNACLGLAFPDRRLFRFVPAPNGNGGSLQEL